MHGSLPHHLLSVTPVVTKLGPIILDRIGAAIIPKPVVKCDENELTKFRKM